MIAEEVRTRRHEPVIYTSKQGWECPATIEFGDEYVEEVLSAILSKAEQERQVY
jgi:hypothetical protein